MKEIFDIYQNRFSDLRKAYEFNITDIKNTRSERAWSTFDFIEEIPIVGWFYKIIKFPRNNAMLKDHLNSL